MISTIQVILTIPQVACYLIRRYIYPLCRKDSNDTKKMKVHLALKKLATEILNSNKAVDIKEFSALFSKKFDPFKQHDSH